MKDAKTSARTPTLALLSVAAALLCSAGHAGAQEAVSRVRATVVGNGSPAVPQPQSVSIERANANAYQGAVPVPAAGAGPLLIGPTPVPAGGVAPVMPSSTGSAMAPKTQPEPVKSLRDPAKTVATIERALPSATSSAVASTDSKRAEKQAEVAPAPAAPAASKTSKTAKPSKGKGAKVSQRATPDDAAPARAAARGGKSFERATVDELAFNASANKGPLELTKEVEARPALGARVEGSVVRHPYGRYHPTIECAVERICVVEFPEDQLSHFSKSWDNKDDWALAFIAPRPGVVMATLSPRAPGMTGNLIVHSGKRTYHLKLVSNPKGGNYMPHSGYYLPEEIVETIRVQVSEARAEARAEALSVPRMTDTRRGIAMPAYDKIRQVYDIKGKADFRPTNVFHDCQKTYVELPPSVRTGTLPVLRALTASGIEALEWTRPYETPAGTLILIADKVIKRGILKLDTGDSAQVVEFSMNNTKSCE